MHSDTDSVDRFQWVGVLGSGLIAAAIVAMGMPWAAEAQSPPAASVQAQQQAAPAAKATAPEAPRR
jgi:hypothetical protein